MVEARVDRIEHAGMALVASGTRFWVPWPLLGLSDVKVQKSSTSLHWRLHCIDPDSKPGDCQGGTQNSYCLRAFKGRRIIPDSTTLRTGILELECAIEPWGLVKQTLCSDGRVRVKGFPFEPLR